MSSPDFGRRGSTGNFTDTVPAKSAEQAALIKQDEMIDKLNQILAAIAASTTGNDLQSGLAAIGTTALSKVKLKP